MKKLSVLLTLLLCFLMVSESAEAGKIEAVQGKRYKLAKNHGPWMVMVAAIRDVEEDRRLDSGLSAWQAADELVYELRQKGIPAYTYTQEEEMGEISSSTHTSSRRYVAQHGYISVLAGNFPSNEDAKAREVLQYIKTKFNPKFLDDPKNGGVLPRTPGRPSALSRAFLTANPMWEGEIRDTEQDNTILALNEDQDYSLLQNKGRYSLIVASFHGGSVMQMEGRDASKALNFFERNFGKSLDQCAMDAIELTEKLRNAKKYGYDQNYEAWVFHEKYKSIVTIGSFDSKDDPRLKAMAAKFSGKPVTDARGKEVLAAETFTIPRVTRLGQIPEKKYVFDGKCQPVAVPRIPQ